MNEVAHSTSDAPTILFLDVATKFGWAYGMAGDPARGLIPSSGSGWFAKGPGASRGAIFGGAMRAITDFISIERPDFIVMEAPLAASLVQGKTNVSTTEILMGLPAAIEGMAYILGCYNVSLVRVASIRKHFIGKNKKGEIAKPEVWRKCLDMGWISATDEDLTYDRTDALAGWSYAETLLAPQLAFPVDQLFVNAEKRKREAAERIAREQQPLLLEDF